MLTRGQGTLEFQQLLWIYEIHYCHQLEMFWIDQNQIALLEDFHLAIYLWISHPCGLLEAYNRNADIQALYIIYIH